MPTSRSGRRRLLDQLSADQQAIALAMVEHRMQKVLEQRLSASQLHALVVLDMIGEVPAGELARHLGISAATATGLIDRLVRDGYAQRRPDPSDGRSRLIDTTDAGQAAWREAVLGPTAMDEAVLSNLDDADLKLLIEASAVLRRAVTTATQDPAGAPSPAAQSQAPPNS